MIKEYVFFLVYWAHRSEPGQQAEPGKPMSPLGLAKGPSVASGSQDDFKQPNIQKLHYWRLARKMRRKLNTAYITLIDYI
jgi:hypothetical protein